MRFHKKRIRFIIAICVMCFMPLYVTMSRRWRTQQFEAAQSIVSQHGGVLTWELVDGNYSVRLTGKSMKDAQITEVTGTLRDLPTGFTLLGPGESRLFHVVLDSSHVSDEGVAELLSLPIEFLFLEGGEISDETATMLAQTETLRRLHLSNVQLSTKALQILQQQSQGTSVTVSTPTSH